MHLLLSKWHSHAAPTPLQKRYRLCVQDGKFPFDLALNSGCSAPILALLQPGSAAWFCVNDDDWEGKTSLPLPLPLVSAEEIKVFASLSHLLDPNPRRLKRIISVYALVTEVAKRVPLSDVDPTACATA